MGNKAADLPWRRWFGVAIAIAILLVVAAVMIPSLEQGRESARKAQSKINLKRIGIAAATYHDTWSVFPPGCTIQADGTALHGWMTQFVPYLDSNSLYNRLYLAQPWDHPVNASVFRIELPPFLSPGEERTITSEGFGLTHYSGNAAVFHRNSKVSINDFKATAARAWLCGEIADNFVPWGYPFNWRELRGPPNSAVGGLGRYSGDGAFVLFGDGHVDFIANAVEPSIISDMVRRPNPPPAALAERPAREFTLVAPPIRQPSWEASGDHQINLRDKDRTTISQIRDAVRHHPGATELQLRRLDDETAEAIRVLQNLIVIGVDRIELTEAGRKSLSKLPALKFVATRVYENDPAELELLEKELPECEVVTE